MKKCGLRRAFYADGGIVQDTAEYWANDNAEFEKTNPNFGQRVVRAVNPMTGFGSAIGAMHTAGGNGDLPGMAMAGISAIPAFGVLRAIPAAGAIKASVAPSLGRTAAAFTGGATANAASDDYQAKRERGYANGGKIIGPGTPTSDSIDATVRETGEPIKVSNGERIVSAAQENVLQGIARGLGFDGLDALLEHGTGRPVGPTIKGGKRAAADGMSPEEKEWRLKTGNLMSEYPGKPSEYNAAASGLRRAFTYGGTPLSLLAQMDKEETRKREFIRSIGIQDQFRADRQSALQARAGDVSGMTGVSNRQKASALGALAEKAGTFGTNITFDTPRGISRTSQMRLGLDRGDAEDRSSMFEENRRQQISSIMGYQQGGKPDDPLARAAALRAKMDAEFGKTATAAPPPAPAPAPAPAPTTAPVPERDKGAFGLFKSLGERAKNYEHGGKGGDEPVYRDERGVIHGPKGIDRVPGEVEETGEPIAVGEGERILNEEQAEALDHHFAKKGMTTDEFLATATDAPVGPTLRRGLRAAELGGTMEPPRSTNAPLAEAMRGPFGQQYRDQLARAVNAAPPSATPAAVTTAPAVMEHHTLPQAMRGAAPTPMMEPLTINNAPAQPQGIVDRAKGLGRQVADAARSVTTGGGGGTSAPTTRPGMGVPGQGLLAEAPAATTGATKTVGQAVGGMAANGLKAAGKGLYKLGVPLTAVTGSAQQVLDPKSETRALWGNDNADLPTKIAGTLESAGNVAGNALTLGMVPNPVTNLVGAFTGGDTALTRGLEGTGHALDPSVPKVAAAAKMAEAAKAAEAEKAAAATAASPLRDPVINKVADESTNSVRGLRAAGVEGPLQGDVVDPATGKTGRQGIRTIQTMNGNVYAGRDKRGQLNVTAGADLSPEQHAALQNAEAARTRADLDRQVRYFAGEKLKSDLASNNPEDRRRGLLALAQQQQSIDARNKELDRDVARRGQDITMRGHELEYGAKDATLKNQMMGQNLERNNKVLDSILGGETVKVDGKDVTNTRRQQILSDMNMTLGQHNMHLGHMTPKDIQEFFTANEIGENTEPAAISKAFSKWVLGKPYVRDFDPHRKASRAQGPEGQSNALGFYSNPNQSNVWGPAALGRQFFTGEYNGPASRYLNGQ